MREILTNKYRGLARILSELGLNKKINNFSTILVKPNMVHPRHPNTGTITHPECIREILGFLLDFYSGRILLGDASSYREADSKETFKLGELYKLSREFGVEIIDFKSFPRALADYRGTFLKEISLPYGIEEWGIINVPKLKEHYIVGMTAAVKNMVGLLENPRVIHDHPTFRQNIEIHERIADVFGAIRFNILFTVLDGITGMRGGQVDGKTIHPNRIIIGEDCLSIDRKCQEYLRLPSNVPKYLDIIEKQTKLFPEEEYDI